MKTKRRRKGSKAVLKYNILENANIATLDKRHTHTKMQ